MGPLAILLVGGTIYYIYEKQKNPAWSPFTRLLSTPVDKVVALEKVKVTSVPTPSPTVALDPHMTTDQVKQVNQTLTSETDPKKIAAHALALGAAGHDNSAMALAAKANAVGEAKATGANDVDIHLKQIEAARATPLEHAPVPIDAPMTACEAQVLLNVLVSRQGHFDVEGVPVPLAITNAFDADTSHLIRIFQAEMHLPSTGTLDAETAKGLRVAALGAVPDSGHVVGWYDDRGYWHHRHHHHHHHPVMEEVIVPEVIEGVVQGVGWGPVASGSGGPVATGFYGHPYGLHHHHPHLWAQDYEGWSQPWQHGYQGWAGWPWHHRHAWHGFVGQRHERREHEHREREREHEHEMFGRGREHEMFGRGREHREHFGRGRERFMSQPQYMPQQQYMQQPQFMEEGMDEEMMPMHPHHRHHRHLTREQVLEQQERERERLLHMQRMHRHHHRHRHPQEMQPAADESMSAQEAAPPAGMPTGGGGGASAMAAPLAVEPDHTADTAPDATATATQGGWWPMPGDEYSYFPQQGLQLTSRGEAAYYPPHEPTGGAAYWPVTPVGDFGGYGYIGEGGLGGLGGYGSWGSFGGWGHGL